MSDVNKRHLMLMPMNRCRNITCKGMGVFGDDYLTPVDERNRSSDFVCTKTQNVLGPDGSLVMLSKCSSERGCFEEL